MNKKQLEQFDENWEKLKSQQSDYLRELYPDWDCSYDGSEPAELAELMNISYYKGIDCGKKAQRQEIIKLIQKKKKAVQDVGTFKYDDIYNELIDLIK